MPAQELRFERPRRIRCISGTYNCAEYLPERRKMMQAWADYIDGLRAGANVVPIKRMTG
jgi:hypothetical protein